MVQAVGSWVVPEQLVRSSQISKEYAHLDFSDCEATSKTQSSPLNSLLMSSKGVARNFGFVFGPFRLWPSRTVLTLSLHVVRHVDVDLEGNTWVQLSFRLKGGGLDCISWFGVEKESVDADGLFRISVCSAIIRGSGL